MNAQPLPPSPNRRRIDAITDTLGAHTGHPFRVTSFEESGGGLLCAWDAQTGRQFMLSVRRQSFVIYQVCLGVRSGQTPVETRLDVQVHKGGLRALLDDPEQVVGLWLGQRAGFFRGRV